VYVVGRPLFVVFSSRVRNPNPSPIPNPNPNP